MQSLYLALLLTLMTGYLTGQNYTPVIINGEVFFKTELLTDEGLVSSEVTVTNLITLDDVFYVRVFLRRGFEPDMLVGYLREDPGTSELFFRGLTGAQEELIYTMDLEVDDQISLPARWCDGQSGDLATVVATHTVEGRKEIVFDRQVGTGELCETLTFLEGVGPSATVMYAYLRDQPIQNGAAQRLCHAFRTDGVFYPTTTDTDFCGLMIVNTEEELASTQLRMWPNPVTEAVHFAGLAPDDRVHVFNAQGQLITQLRTDGPLDVSAWAAGVYVVRKTGKNDVAVYSRLLVQ
ncbi:MAG: T9SS type A sorting domain-containing protein [Bacteroidota bacterium]